MSKSKEELNKLKEEVEAVNEKLAELTPEEIAQITGGVERPGLLTMRVFEPIVRESVAPGRALVYTKPVVIEPQPPSQLGLSE